MSKIIWLTETTHATTWVFEQMRRADLVISTTGVILKDRHGPDGRQATAEEIAQATRV